MRCLGAAPREDLCRFHRNDLPEGDLPLPYRSPENRVRRHITWEGTTQVRKEDKRLADSTGFSLNAKSSITCSYPSGNAPATPSVGVGFLTRRGSDER
jgi:hypothetical protein